MSIEFGCGQCGKNHLVREAFAGTLAKCSCGARIMIPLRSDVQPKDLFDNVQMPIADSAMLVTAPVDLSRKDVQARPAVSDAAFGLDKLFQDNGSAFIKIAVGAIVGGIAGLTALLRERNGPPIEKELQIPIVIGAAVAGAVAASLLVVADAVRARKKDGRKVPAILRWYFSSGLLSLVLWIVTVFVGVFVIAVFDVWTL